jgi:hypothetical protein
MVTREEVEYAYRFILGREPESKEAFRYWMEQESTVEILREKFLNSEEFKNFNQRLHFYNGFDREDVQLLNKYREHNISPEGGYLTDFMGIKHSETPIEDQTVRLFKMFLQNVMM